jgi:beta,beta-carotene 9',10'-dioxygenase
MIHKFTIVDSKVYYSNRFLHTKAYKLAMTTGEMASGFTTAGGTQVHGGNNTNVNISTIDDRFAAMTESPEVIEFNPFNLDTVGVLKFDDTLGGQLTTAHPHIDSLPAFS